MIETVQLEVDGKGAFVKFHTKDDVEFAIKRNGKEPNMRIYRCTERQMQMDRKKGLARLSMPVIAPIRRGISAQNGTKTGGSTRAMKFLKVYGLPGQISESYVLDLFPGKHKFTNIR